MKQRREQCAIERARKSHQRARGKSGRIVPCSRAQLEEILLHESVEFAGADQRAQATEFTAHADQHKQFISSSEIGNERVGGVKRGKRVTRSEWTRKELMRAAANLTRGEKRVQFLIKDTHPLKSLDGTRSSCRVAASFTRLGCVANNHRLQRRQPRAQHRQLICERLLPTIERMEHRIEQRSTARAFDCFKGASESLVSRLREQFESEVFVDTQPRGGKRRAMRIGCKTTADILREFHGPRECVDRILTSPERALTRGGRECRVDFNNINTEKTRARSALLRVAQRRSRIALSKTRTSSAERGANVLKRACVRRGENCKLSGRCGIASRKRKFAPHECRCANTSRITALVRESMGARRIMLGFNRSLHRSERPCSHKEPSRHFGFQSLVRAYYKRGIQRRERFSMRTKCGKRFGALNQQSRVMTRCKVTHGNCGKFEVAERFTKSAGSREEVRTIAKHHGVGKWQGCHERLGASEGGVCSREIIELEIGFAKRVLDRAARNRFIVRNSVERAREARKRIGVFAAQLVDVGEIEFRAGGEISARGTSQSVSRSAASRERFISAAEFRERMHRCDARTSVFDFIASDRRRNLRVGRARERFGQLSGVGKRWNRRAKGAGIRAELEETARNHGDRFTKRTRNDWIRGGLPFALIAKCSEHFLVASLIVDHRVRSLRVGQRRKACERERCVIARGATRLTGSIRVHVSARGCSGSTSAVSIEPSRSPTTTARSLAPAGNTQANMPRESVS